MDFFSVLALLGGLAIFLYGMNLMGDGLAKVAGGKLERILETLTECWQGMAEERGSGDPGRVRRGPAGR